MQLIGTRVAWDYAILILLYCINTSFAQSTQHVLVRSELTPKNFYMKVEDAYETVLSFFRPVTCRHRDGQTLIACDLGEGLNATECLENNCCPSETHHELKCYVPFEDSHHSLQNMQLIFRVLLLVAGGLLLLGCLPLCCCACLQRSPCVNPLKKANLKVKQIVQKKKAHSDDTYALLLDDLEKDS